ncbi:KAP family P-loop domain protein [Acinetobacter beijerinckii]|uniref:KAP family P-loop domain protein n=1 Tax=Acinetobacter beijerinckii TaxID=262668 RepID=UPI00300AE5E2
MDILEKEKRLKERLEHNIRYEDIGAAIAITGSWGVGKTFFWKSFLDKQLCDERIYKKDNVFNRKYAYVSLFGLESLSDLKTHIYSSIESFHSSIEIPKWIKSLPSILKDTRVSQFGLNASTKIFDSLMFNQVKDAIICFDDFERMSNKLDIKDVMGLANYLKLEKNCQIILILDEDKAEGDNKQKYADYKEKLVDETIIINSVEPLIRKNAQDIDDQLVSLMVDFADKLDIHNFRFFQKVLKLYQQFRKELPEEVADSTKEIILIRILQGYLIQDFRQLDYGWEDCQYFTEQKRENWSDRKKQTYESLQKVSYLFAQDDLWFLEFKKWFEQCDRVDFYELNKLANSTLISEKNNKSKNYLYNLMDKWRNLEVNESYCDQIFSLSKAVVGVETLENLYFYSDLLKKFGRDDLSRELNQSVKENLKHCLNQDAVGTINLAFDSGCNRKNLFHRYLKYWQYHNHDLILPSLFNVMSNYLLSKSWNDRDEVILKNATKNDWEDLIWNKIPNDPRFTQIHKMSLINKIFGQHIDVSLTPQIKSMIFELLEEKALDGDIYLRKNTEFLIAILKEN